MQGDEVIHNPQVLSSDWYPWRHNQAEWIVSHPFPSKNILSNTYWIDYYCEGEYRQIHAAPLLSSWFGGDGCGSYCTKSKHLYPFVYVYVSNRYWSWEQITSHSVSMTLRFMGASSKWKPDQWDRWWTSQYPTCEQIFATFGTLAIEQTQKTTLNFGCATSISNIICIFNRVWTEVYHCNPTHMPWIGCKVHLCHLACSLSTMWLRYNLN